MPGVVGQHAGGLKCVQNGTCLPVGCPGGVLQVLHAGPSALLGGAKRPQQSELREVPVHEEASSPLKRRHRHDGLLLHADKTWPTRQHHRLLR